MHYYAWFCLSMLVGHFALSLFWVLRLVADLDRTDFIRTLIITIFFILYLGGHYLG